MAVLLRRSVHALRCRARPVIPPIVVVDEGTARRSWREPWRLTTPYCRGACSVPASKDLFGTYIRRGRVDVVATPQAQHFIRPCPKDSLQLADKQPNDDKDCHNGDAPIEPDVCSQRMARAQA
jgi:hypothetical protein